MGVSFRSKDFLLSDSEGVTNKIDAHLHKYYEFLYFEKGDASYITGDMIYKLNPGDITITKPNELHAISFASECLYKRIFIQMSAAMLSYIPLNLINNIISKKQGKNDVIKSEITAEYDLKKYFEKGSRFLQNPTEKNIFLARLLFNEFAITINEAMNSGDNKDPITGENELVSQIKGYIDANYSVHISLDTIAKKFFTNKYHICHVFKSETGITISDYISLRRISSVREKITDSMSINEAYKLCGFNDYSAFYRTVKKYTGSKPSDFYK